MTKQGRNKLEKIEKFVISRDYVGFCRLSLVISLVSQERA